MEMVGGDPIITEPVKKELFCGLCLNPLESVGGNRYKCLKCGMEVELKE